MVKILLLAILFLVTAKSKAALVCPDDWKEFDNSCYKVMENYLQSSTFDWLKALRVCLGFGGNLASIADEAEMEFLSSMSSKLTNHSAWIGLVYSAGNGEYNWSDGTPFDNSVHAHWFHENPANKSLGGNYFCADLWRRGLNFTRCGCKENQFYICKRPKGPIACPDGWFLNGSSCYQASDILKWWSEARESCSSSTGGHLAKVDDTDEQQFIAVYIGVTGQREGNTPVTHVWVDEKSNDKCVQIHTTSGEKSEENCRDKSFYICEQPVAGYPCYKRPSNTSSNDCSVNCTYPESLCFKHRYNDSVVIQGCMSADQCTQIKTGNQSNTGNQTKIGSQTEHLECCQGKFCNTEISCYECSSNTSFEDCTRKQTVVNCPIPVHRCAKMEYKRTVEEKERTSFQKGCATIDQCEITSERIVDCCGDDQCNTDSGLRCYECGNAKEECPVRQCIFNDGQCYYAQRQEGSNADNKYGCTQQDLCNKTDGDGHFRHCCNGSLCNKVRKDNKDQTGQENVPSHDTNSNTLAYVSLAVTFILLVLVSLAIGVYCYRKSYYKKIQSLPHTRRDIIPLDKWEILPEQIDYEEELGRGAFGVVHKATLQRRVGVEVFDARKLQFAEEKRKKACQVVAVKNLKDDANEAQKEEFLSEIEQMKLLGYHQNIVSLVGCSTLLDNKFLVIEYVPFGDLLQWLRRQRKMINQSENTEGKNGEKDYDDKNDITEDGKWNNTFDQEIHNDKDQFPEKMELTPIQDITDVTVDFLPSEKTSENPVNEKEVDRNPSLGGQTSVMAELAPPPYSQDDTMQATLLSEELTETTDCGNLPDEGMLSVPSTSQADTHAAAVLIFADDLDEEADDKEEDGFTTKQLFSFAWQIARGMNHLAENGFVHRDLAARNVLVGHDGKVKVSDFGLMRQIYEDVYNSEKTKKLPVKWMAPESLYEGIYTIKSDVWSYGVLLWEMATLGGVPYPTLTNSELFQLLNTGYRMDRPDMCCDEVHDLMTECWKEDSSHRPSFFQLIEKLELLMERDVPYLDINKHNETSPYYQVPTEASAAVDNSKL